MDAHQNDNLVDGAGALRRFGEVNPRRCLWSRTFKDKTEVTCGTLRGYCYWTLVCTLGEGCEL